MGVVPCPVPAPVPIVTPVARIVVASIADAASVGGYPAPIVFEFSVPNGSGSGLDTAMTCEVSAADCAAAPVTVDVLWFPI